MNSLIAETLFQNKTEFICTWTHASQHPNGITIGSAAFAGLTVMSY